VQDDADLKVLLDLEIIAGAPVFGDDFVVFTVRFLGHGPDVVVLASLHKALCVERLAARGRAVMVGLRQQEASC
jgi:hypothetical protein